jgi:5-methylthioadenosine/S-adenosylhomocysteine deaminase
MYTLDEASLRASRQLADRYKVPMLIHLAETEDEVSIVRERHKMTPAAWLASIGLLGPNVVAAHGVWLTDEDIGILQRTGASVSHNPESNMKLASGAAPVPKCLAAGVTVGLGTDGAASNNDLDMLGELRTAALLAKGVAQDPSAVPAATALRMATLNGAKALGLGEAIGSLEPGKEADMVAVDLSFPETQPVHHPISQLVYAAGRRQVSHVWVAGRPVLLEGRLTTVDLDKIRADAEQWRERIAGG